MPNFSLLDKYTIKTELLPKSVLKNTLIISNSLLLSGDVNLNKAKDKVPLVTGKMTNTPEGDYKRLTRYFDYGNIKDDDDNTAYNELLCGLRSLSWLVLFHQTKGSRRKFSLKNINYLLLDGTKWDFGSHHLHLLTLCIVIDDVAIPIWWEDLEKAGHSSQEDRAAYISKAMESYELGGMTLIADREYTGYKWFRELDRIGIRFVIRVKEGIYHEEINAAPGLEWKRMKAKAHDKPKGKKVSKKITLDGLDLFYIILKNPRPNADDELVYLITDWLSPAKAARIYELRWQIEVCFKHLKSNGLNLEKMSVRGKEKRHLMMAIAVLIYILAIREGIIKEVSQKDGVPYKKDKYTGFYYRTESVFRKGLSILLRKFTNGRGFIRYLKSIIDKQFHFLLQNV